MIGDHLKAFPPSGSIVDVMKTAFTTAIMQAAERVAPPRAPRLQERGRGDAQAEAEISMAMSARRATWKRQRADTQNSQLMRAVWRENMRFHRVCNDAYERFLERHVQGTEEDLRQRDQRGLFQRFKSEHRGHAEG